jgi:hypothetical protein
VCLYRGSQTSRATGKFRDVTTGWQWFTRSRGAKSVRNASPHAAHLLTTSGRVVCVGPHSRGGLYSGGFAAIRIGGRHC